MFSFWNSSWNQLFLNTHNILCFENVIAMKSLFRYKIIANSQAKGTHLPDFKMMGVILEKFNLQGLLIARSKFLFTHTTLKLDFFLIIIILFLFSPQN